MGQTGHCAAKLGMALHSKGLARHGVTRSNRVR
jgi:hypothetical protein